MLARIMQQYRYSPETWNGTGNIGDCIQNIAVENLYKEMGISDREITKINRDDIHLYNGQKVILPMQGWFGNAHNVFSLNWSNCIHPVFVGFHLSESAKCREKFVEEKIYVRMKEFEPIGCRDRNTRDFLKQYGVSAYFSGCLTLTFSKRDKKPENGKIFIVDLIKEAESILPDKIKLQADRTITHEYFFRKYPVSFEEAMEFEREAEKILKRYKNEARLVITSRIHCAMPCVAMGIPVIFIHKNLSDSRFDVLNGIIPIYSINTPHMISWNPEVPDIEELKNCMKKNFFCQIQKNLEKKDFDKNTEIQILEKLQKIEKNLNFKGKFFGFFINLVHKIKLCIDLKHKMNKLYKQIQKTKNQQIVFWGASVFLEKFLYIHRCNNSNILGIIDKNPELYGKIMGKYKIYPPEKIKELKPDFVIMTIENNSRNAYDSISEYLKETGFSIKLMPNIFDTKD